MSLHEVPSAACYDAEKWLHVVCTMKYSATAKCCARAHKARPAGHQTGRHRRCQAELLRQEHILGGPAA
eukprot:6856675-Alexandrium_andersonii.AAC.1